MYLWVPNVVQPLLSRYLQYFIDDGRNVLGRHIFPPEPDARNVIRGEKSENSLEIPELKVPLMQRLVQPSIRIPTRVAQPHVEARIREHERWKRFVLVFNIICFYATIRPPNMLYITKINHESRKKELLTDIISKKSLITYRVIDWADLPRNWCCRWRSRVAATRADVRRGLRL